LDVRVDEGGVVGKFAQEGASGICWCHGGGNGAGSGSGKSSRSGVVSNLSEPDKLRVSRLLAQNLVDYIILDV